MVKVGRILLTIVFMLLATVSAWATNITVQSHTVTGWQHNVGTTAKLRIYADQTFITSDGKTVIAGSPNGVASYIEVSVTINTTTKVATIAQFDIDSTRDASSPIKTAVYNAFFYTNEGRRLATFMESFAIPASFDTGTVCTWKQIALFNRPLVPLPIDRDTYTREVIDAKIAAINGLSNPMNTLGDIIAGGTGGMVMRVGGNTASDRKFLVSQGTGSAANLPSFSALTSADITTALTYTPVNKAGDTMTGLLTLSGAPTATNHAATKGYVDGLLGGGGIVNLNGLTASTQTFAVAASFPEFTVTSASSTHTFGFSGQLATTRGGTGIGAYATGDIIFASNTNVLSALAAAAAGNVLISGTTPSWAKVGLTTHVSGLLPTANGGSAANLSTGTGYFKIATSGQPAALQATIPATDGGTGFASYTAFDTIYANTTTSLAKLGANTTTTRKFLRMVGDGVSGAAPSWEQIDLTGSDVVNALPPTKGGTGLSSLSTGYLRSNGSAFSIQALPLPATDLLTTMNLNGVVYAGAGSALNSTSAGATGTVLVGNTSAAPSFTGTPTLTSLTLSGLTQGSVVFVGASGLLTQNTSRLTWDNTLFKLDVQGELRLKGATSGQTGFKAPATVTGGGGTVIYTLPAADGTNGQALLTDGAGGLSWGAGGGGGGGGISTLNGLTAAIQTFAVGTSGTDFNISSVTSTHTYNIPTMDSGITRGLMSNGTQSIAGAKTWTSANTFQALTTLAANTTTIAPIRFPAPSALLTSAVAYTVEYDGTRLYYTNSGATRKSVAHLDDNITGNAAGFTGSLSGDISGTQSATTYNNVVPRAKGGLGNDPGSPSNGMVLRFDSGTGNVLFSFDGGQLNGLNASNLAAGTVPLARLSGITNTEISAAAAIAWTKIDKTGSSLADLSTRSVTNLTEYLTTSGTGTVALRTTITGVVANDVLAWDGSNWVNSSVLPSGGGWRDDGTVVRLIAASDQVAIGTPSPTALHQFTLLQQASNSGSPRIMQLTGATHTALAADTEASDVVLGFNRDVEFTQGAGSFLNQRAMYVRKPTYKATAGETITTAATVAIEGAPVASTNMTLTSTYALLVEGGLSRFDTVQTNGQAAITINQFNTGAGQTGELRFQEGGAAAAEYVGLKAPDSMSANAVFTLPAVDGAADEVLTTNGSKVLSFKSLASMGMAGWTDDGTVVRLTTATDDVSIGTATMPASTKLNVRLDALGHTGLGIQNPTGTKRIDFNINAADDGAFEVVDRGANGLLLQSLAGQWSNAVNGPVWAVSGFTNGLAGDMLFLGRVGLPLTSLGFVANSTKFSNKGNSTDSVPLANVQVEIFQDAKTTGTGRTMLRVAGGALTTQTADTEAIDVYLKLARDVEFSAGAGAFASQRAFYVERPSYKAAAAESITSIATMALQGAPGVGTNLTVTNSYGVLIEAGSNSGTPTNAASLAIADAPPNGTNKYALWVQNGVSKMAGYAPAYAEKNANYTTTINDNFLSVDAGAGGVTINLIAVASVPVGFELTIKKIAGAGSVTIDPNGTETIDDDSASRVLSGMYTSLTIVSDGDEWFIK